MDIGLFGFRTSYAVNVYDRGVFPESLVGLPLSLGAWPKCGSAVRIVHGGSQGPGMDTDFWPFLARGACRGRRHGRAALGGAPLGRARWRRNTDQCKDAHP